MENLPLRANLLPSSSRQRALSHLSRIYSAITQNASKKKSLIFLHPCCKTPSWRNSLFKYDDYTKVDCFNHPALGHRRVQRNPTSGTATPTLFSHNTVSTMVDMLLFFVGYLAITVVMGLELDAESVLIGQWTTTVVALGRPGVEDLCLG